MNGNKIALALTFILCFSLFLSGCTDENPASNLGNEVNSPISINYLVENQITLETVSVDKLGEALASDKETGEDTGVITNSTSSDFAGQLILIEGLKDENVQNAINDRIKELYLSCVDTLPPYRGAKVGLGEDYVISEQRIDMYSAGNFNNILSIILNKNARYSNASGLGRNNYMSQIETLNFDLNTGQEIPLAQLFCDDVDAIAFVDEYMADFLQSNNADEEVWSGMENLNINSPFMGLSEDQKFSIYEGALNLIFDYETPEFQTDFSAHTVSMPFTEKMAVTERFFNEDENIYTANEPWVKRLLLKTEVADERYERYEDGEISLSIDARWSSELPESMQKIMRDLCEIDSNAIIIKMQPYLDEAKKDYREENISAYYYKSAYANHIGSFLNITEYESMDVSGANWLSEKEDRTTYMSENRQRAFCYRIDTGEPVKIRDLFVEGFDYELAIKKAMAASVRDQFIENSQWSGREAYDFGNGVTKEKDLQYIENLYSAITGVSVGTDRLTFSLSSDPGDVFKQVYGMSTNDYTDGSQYLYSALQAKYKDLGCGNLNIFD